MLPAACSRCLASTCKALREAAVTEQWLGEVTIMIYNSDEAKAAAKWLERNEGKPVCSPLHCKLPCPLTEWPKHAQPNASTSAMVPICLQLLQLWSWAVAAGQM
jgi:hypothetical protein